MRVKELEFEKFDNLNNKADEIQDIVDAEYKSVDDKKEDLVKETVKDNSVEQDKALPNFMENEGMIDAAINTLSKEQQYYLKIEATRYIKDRQVNAIYKNREEAIQELSKNVIESATTATKSLDDMFRCKELQELENLQKFHENYTKTLSVDEQKEVDNLYKHLAVQTVILQDKGSSKEHMDAAQADLYNSLEKTYKPFIEGKTFFELSDVKKNFIYDKILTNLEKRETGYFVDGKQKDFEYLMRGIKGLRYSNEVMENPRDVTCTGFLKPELFYNDCRDGFRERLENLSPKAQEDFKKLCRLAANVAMNNDKWVDSAKKMTEIYLGENEKKLDYIWEHITKYASKEKEVELEKKKRDEAKEWQQVFLNAQHIMQRMNCEKGKDNKYHYYGYFDDGKEVRRYNLGKKQDCFENLMQTAYHLTMQQIGTEKALPLDNELDRFDKNKESIDSYLRRQHDKYRKSISISKMAWNSLNESSTYKPVLNKEMVNKYCDAVLEASNKLNKDNKLSKHSSKQVSTAIEGR